MKFSGHVFVMGLAWLALPIQLACGQDSNPSEQASYVPQSLRAAANISEQKHYEDTTRCQRCHSNGLFSEDVRDGIGDRVSLKEATYWTKADHHADAYSVLISNDKRAERIRELLKLSLEDVRKPETGCVQCHAPLRGVATTSEALKGVNCEVCHGPSSAWYPLHDRVDDAHRPTWPTVKPDEKTELGWIDVHSPISRAELCASCHVGSAQHGRVITHAMYAAGHPPLSGFEIESFADQMPRHWRYSNEKQSGSSMIRSRNLLVGAVVSMRMGVELAAADAAAPNSGRWPELARLDCYTCHHELVTPSSRSVQSGLPGRPPISVGSLPLARLAAEVARGPQGSDGLQKQLLQLQAAFKSDSFGDPEKLSQAAASIIAWCRKLEVELSEMDLQPRRVREVLQQIAERSIAEPPDYDNLRQLLGAWIVMYGELPESGDAAITAEQRKQIDEVFRLMTQKWPNLAESKPTSLKCGSDAPEKRDYNAALVQHFANRESFAPQEFQMLMSRLATILGKSP